MRSPSAVYPAVLLLIRALGLTRHKMTQRALAERVLAVLTAQSLAPADLARAVLSAMTVPARQRFRRVARTWTCPLLTSGRLTPVLVRAALALVRPSAPLLALDSVRCGRWEIYTVGLVWHRRVLLVGWRVLPYPLPRGQFTPQVCALLTAVDQAWPATVPKPALVADRGFPGYRFFATLVRLQWAFTIRLRATDWVTLGGVFQPVRALLATATPECWEIQPATYGKAGAHGFVVVGRGLQALPWHQRDDGSARARQHRLLRRQHDLRNKHPKREPDRSAETDAWVVLFTSDARWLPAVRAYRRRWAIEGTYRDGQSGWNGRYGWNLEPVIAHAHTADHVDHVIGLWSVALVVQSWVGDQVGQSTAPDDVRALTRQWTTTGRLSLAARGRFAFADRSGVLEPWLIETIQAGASRITAGAAQPAAAEVQQAA